MLYILKAATAKSSRKNFVKVTYVLPQTDLVMEVYDSCKSCGANMRIFTSQKYKFKIRSCLIKISFFEISFMLRTKIRVPSATRHFIRAYIYIYLCKCILCLQIYSLDVEVVVQSHIITLKLPLYMSVCTCVQLYQLPLVIDTFPHMLCMSAHVAWKEHVHEFQYACTRASPGKFVPSPRIQ
jgi:hypothetical protein